MKKEKTSPEFDAFTNLLTQVLSVSHSELQTRMKKYKKESLKKPKRGPKPKTTRQTSAPASSGSR